MAAEATPISLESWRQHLSNADIGKSLDHQWARITTIAWPDVGGPITAKDLDHPNRIRVNTQDSSGRVRFLNMCDTLFDGIDSISFCIDHASIGFEQRTSDSISDKNFG